MSPAGLIYYSLYIVLYSLLHRFLYHLFKHRWLVKRQFGKHFAIYRNALQGHLVNKTAVLHAKLFAGGVDPHDPQIAESTFFRAAMSVGICACLHDRILRLSEIDTAKTSITFGSLYNLAVPTVGGDASFYSSHIKKLATN